MICIRKRWQAEQRAEAFIRSRRFSSTDNLPPVGEGAIQMKPHYVQRDSDNSDHEGGPDLTLPLS